MRRQNTLLEATGPAAPSGDPAGRFPYRALAASGFRAKGGRRNRNDGV